MRVEPFSTLEALADCKPGSLVRDAKDNTLGLVVAQKALEPKTTGCLLRLEGLKADQPVVPCYREFTDPRPVLVYNNQDYVFLIDDFIRLGSTFSGGGLCETPGALLLNGSAWYMCLISGQGRQAYDIGAGTLVPMPKLDETAAFASWTLNVRSPGYDGKAWITLATWGLIRDNAIAC